MGELSKLPNIGKTLEEQLEKIGINSIEKLKETGSKQAWSCIKAIDSSACYNRLCALEGAIEGIRWHDLSEEVKKELKEFYQAYNKSCKRR